MDAPTLSARAYEVSVVGRWSEIDFASPGPALSAQVQGGATPATPLAGHALRVRGRGRQRPTARRAAVGDRGSPLHDRQGRGLRLARRRHLYEPPAWRDLARQRRWWVADAGSTNGIRVESPTGGVERCGAAAGCRRSTDRAGGRRTHRAVRTRRRQRERLSLGSAAAAPEWRGARHADRRRRAVADHAADADPRVAALRTA